MGYEPLVMRKLVDVSPNPFESGLAIANEGRENDL